MERELFRCVVCGAASEDERDFNVHLVDPEFVHHCGGECTNIYLHSEMYAEAIWPDVPVLD